MALDANRAELRDTAMRNLVSSAAFLAILSAVPATAQQFQMATNFPGTALWSEGVECSDVDHDGDLDIFVADGGNFSSAGTARQNLLWINQTAQGTPYGLVDESIARLGMHTSHAKGVTAGDINGDGWDDAMFVSAFFTSPPFVYVNQGIANPGFFTFEGAARGFTTNYSSGSAQFADLDDDGDLDVIVNERYNSGTAGAPHLFFNNGAGFFTENAAALGAPNKASQMDVQFADIDNDWDFDFVGFNKATAAPGQYVMRNNGAGTFSDSSSLLVANSGNVYEGEIGDLDGDLDLDLFVQSLSGASEGVARNNFAPAGPLTFTNQTAFGGDDDNEIALFDYDVDGDYDVLVGSLRAGSEKLYRNNGALSFTDQSAQVQNTNDATLDLSVADLNNDGKYDIVTIQGESGTFINKFLRNTGAADTLPPVFTATLAPSSPPAIGPWVVKAKVRDQVLDDGVDYVTGSATYVVQAVASDVGVSVLAGGAFSSPTAVVPAGTRLVFTNATGGTTAVACATAPYAFASGTIGIGGTYDAVVVESGAYVFTNTSGAGTCTVTVAGATSVGAWRKAGPQIQRFTLTDTLAGAGSRVCYELRTRDWPGNVRAVTGYFDMVPATIGTLFCFGDGSGTACPCGNAGGAGRGCASSVSASGGLVQATGNPSLSADTVVLAGSGMPNSSALYFQGTTQQSGGLGAVFGDGLRCAGGTIVRLGTKTNVGSASIYPVGGDPSVSVRGAIGAPGSRTYQVWYRNAAAFCTSDTFNLTNGTSIVWGA